MTDDYLRMCRRIVTLVVAPHTPTSLRLGLQGNVVITACSVTPAPTGVRGIGVWKPTRPDSCKIKRSLGEIYQGEGMIKSVGEHERGLSKEKVIPAQNWRDHDTRNEIHLKVLTTELGKSRVENHAAKLKPPQTPPQPRLDQNPPRGSSACSNLHPRRTKTEPLVTFEGFAGGGGAF